MKKLVLAIIMVGMMIIPGAAFCADMLSPASGINALITGPTIQAGVSTFTLNGRGTDKDGYLATGISKPSLGVFSWQLEEISPYYATDISSTGVTISYTTSNSGVTWSSGTTKIWEGYVSGQTTEVVSFFPEFALFYKIIFTGQTIFQRVKGTLATQ